MKYAYGRNDKGQFVRGRRETDEEKAKRLETLKESWKHRTDYIADLRLECPKLYNSWRAMRFTEKGKKAGNAKEWDDFRTFYNDVRPFYIDGGHFRRIDATKPFSKDNFHYITKKDLDDYEIIKRNSEKVEVNGEFYSLREVSDMFQVPYGTIRRRYKANNDATLEELLFGKIKNRKAKPVKDYTESSTPLRSKASKMISSYRLKDKKLGLEPCDITIDWMIENIIKQPCVYCGDTHRVGCDRINNDKGHTMDNVVPCCYDCNCARNNNFTHEEMFIIGETIRKVKSNRVTQKL